MSEDNSNLEFRKVPSLSYLYEINSSGTIFRNVKSKRHIQIRLDMHHSQGGYYVSFVCLGGKVRRCMIHRLVAECWLGQCPEGMQVDHIDRNSRNNDFRNLRYATHSMQMKNRTLSPETIERVIFNCQQHNARISKPVILSNGTEEVRQPSYFAAARWLAQATGRKVEHCRNKLKKRRKFILGWAVTYLNAETVR